MRVLKTALPYVLVLFALVGLIAAQGPIIQDPGQTVAKKKPSADSTTPPPDDGTNLPKIPSAYKKEKTDPGEIATFKADVDVVTLDVAVVDPNGQFIPTIPASEIPRAGRQRSATDPQGGPVAERCLPHTICKRIRPWSSRRRPTDHDADLTCTRQRSPGDIFLLVRRGNLGQVGAIVGRRSGGIGGRLPL